MIMNAGITKVANNTLDMVNFGLKVKLLVHTNFHINYTMDQYLKICVFVILVIIPLV